MSADAKDSLSHTKHRIETQKCAAAHRLNTIDLDIATSDHLTEENTDHIMRYISTENELYFFEFLFLKIYVMLLSQSDEQSCFILSERKEYIVVALVDIALTDAIVDVLRTFAILSVIIN